MKSCLKYAVKKKAVDVRILDLNEIVIPNEDNVKKETRQVQFLSEEDSKKFIKEAARINTQGFNFGGKIGEPTYGNNAKMLLFILYTGLRISEAIALKWKDINPENKTMLIVSTSKGRKGDSSTKTKSSTRVVPLSASALQILEYEKGLYSKSDYVFVTKNGGKVASRQNVNRTLSAIMSRAGCSVDDLTPHELRHTFGSTLLRNGVDIKTVSVLLGHKDIRVTYNVYIHILQEQQVTAVEVLDKLNNI